MVKEQEETPIKPSEALSDPPRSRAAAQPDREGRKVALRAAERRYKAFFENIPLMYFTLDGDGVVLSVSPYGARELGYEPHELVGRPVLEVFHPEDRDAVERHLKDSLARPGDVAGWEFRKVRQDGSVLWVRESVRTVQTEDGQREILVACQDVTELKRIERRVRQHEERLKSLTSALALAEERERRRIAGGLHDRIGATLAAAKMKLGELKRSGLSGEAVQPIAEIEELIGGAIQTTRSLTFELSSPILYELGLEAAIEELGERMTAQNSFLFRFESDGHPKPLTDDARVVMYRVVREVLFNVTKHAQAQNAKVAVKRVGDQVRITLEDDGIGFDPAGVEDRVGPSGGFGLFSAREQLDALGGRIEIETAPGKGTRIVLEAPLTKPPQET